MEKQIERNFHQCHVYQAGQKIIYSIVPLGVVKVRQIHPLPVVIGAYYPIMIVTSGHGRRYLQVYFTEFFCLKPEISGFI